MSGDDIPIVIMFCITREFISKLLDAIKNYQGEKEVTLIEIGKTSFTVKISLSVCVKIIKSIAPRVTLDDVFVTCRQFNPDDITFTRRSYTDIVDTFEQILNEYIPEYRN